jgi:hypothetical protein
MKDLTSKLLAEKYELIKESESSIRLPEGFTKTRNILVETAHGAKPLKVYEIWMEGDTCKISIDVPSPAEEGKPAGAATINPKMALEEKKPEVKKEPKKKEEKKPFAKNPFVNAMGDRWKGLSK